MEEINAQQSAQFCAWMTAVHTQVQTDVAGEFVLPDYYRDMRRLLCVQSEAQIDGHYFKGERLEYDGVLHLSVLYIAEDDSVQNATFSIDFSDGMAMEEEQEEYALFLNPNLLTITPRVLSPRKLHIKGKIGTQILLRRKECIAPRLVGEHSAKEEQTLQYKKNQIETMEFLSATVKDLTLSHTIEIGANLPPIEQVCRLDATLRLEEAHWQPNGLSCQGTLFLQCLYHGQDGQGNGYATVQESVPVSVAIDEPFWEGYTYRVTPFIRRRKEEIAQNPYGEQRLLTVTIEYDLQVEAAQNSTVTTICDLYSTEYACEVHTAKMAVPTLAGIYHSNLTIRETKDRIELGLENAQELLFLSAQPQIHTMEHDAQKNRLHIEGEVLCSALFSCGAEVPCQDTQFRLPFQMDLAGVSVAAEPEYRYDCRIIGSGGRLDSKSFYPNLELGVDVMVSSVTEHSIVESVELDAQKPFEPCTQWVFAYPDANATLWDVAKEYHTTTAALIQANDLPNEERIGKRVLFIAYE